MPEKGPDWIHGGTNLTSIAIRVYRLQAMLSFYSEAFGLYFEPVDTGPVLSHFADMGSITLKLVPIRDAVDFEEWPVHQLGFKVEDIDRTISLAEKYGGATLGTPVRENGRSHAAVRDPDGNSIELYSFD